MAVLCVAALASACGTERATSTAPDTPAFAKGGPSGGGQGGVVTVTSVEPAIAPTDTILDVLVDGSNFDRTARAKWSIQGDTTQVKVLSTSYVNSGRVKARIQVPQGARIGDYDVAIELDGGKKGIGAELFRVILGDPKVDWFIPLADATLGLQSDRLFSDGTYSVYEHGVCRVGTNLFATSAASGSGDATIHMNSGSKNDKGCAQRTVRFRYEDGHVDQREAFMNLREIQNGLYTIPEGQTVSRIFAASVLTATKGVRCSALRWRGPWSSGAESDQVLVTRISSSTWHARTLPYPANRAVCLDDNQVYHLSVEFIIKARTTPWNAM